MTDSVKAALQKDITTLTFSDNSYLDEAFISRCVVDGFAGWYDQRLVEHQVDFILHRCPVLPGASVLDVACGHGKHSESLARRGFRVLGTDVSSALIMYLSQKGIERAEFRCMRFGQMDFPAEFDLALVLGNSLSLVPRLEMPAAVRQLAASLAPNGCAFIEMDNGRYFVSNEAGRKTWTHQGGDWIMLSDHYYDPLDRLEKTIDTTFDLNDGSVDQFLLTKALYHAEELLDCLRKAGLEIVSVFGDWDGNELNEQSRSILVLSRRAP